MRSTKVFTTGACVLAAFVVGGGIAAADDTTVPPPPPAAAAESTFTLPLLGSPLIVDVTTDAGGGLVDVSLNQAGEFTVTQVKPNRVRFVNTDGTISVKVSAKHGGARVEARAGQLSEIIGAGEWSGDVFETGDPTTVKFTVSAGADGGPDITGVSVTSPVGFVIGDTVRETEDDDDEIEQSASVTIEFSQNGQTRSLRIKATLETEDGETQAKLSIRLSRLQGLQLADGPAAGPHTWTGQLCDGTIASVTYVVSIDGQVSDVASSVLAEVDVDGNHAKIRFSDDERISIKVSGEGGSMTVGVSKKIRCDRVDPTVNGSVVPTTIDDDDDDSDHDSDEIGDDDSDHDDDKIGDDDSDSDDDHDSD